MEDNTEQVPVAPAPVDAPVQTVPETPVEDTSVPTDEVVLGSSSDGGVVVEPTPVIQ